MRMYARLHWNAQKSNYHSYTVPIWPHSCLVCVFWLFAAFSFLQILRLVNVCSTFRLHYAECEPGNTPSSPQHFLVMQSCVYNFALLCNFKFSCPYSGHFPCVPNTSGLSFAKLILIGIVCIFLSRCGVFFGVVIIWKHFQVLWLALVTGRVS